ncbi:tyrosine-protein phosphatase [Demetria terragena]|uniref:tyrosine-protein phosphatase n=1 Tax=Demetria terragena TaxID=63959 RepID=UPI0012EA2179|nr:tyrosine-protein phosphatase [Demetria terragena]
MSIAWIDLDGLANMRDLGGTPVAGGGAIQPGRLLRSDNLQDLTPGDIDELVDRRALTDIIDLRSDVEVHFTGPGPLAEVSSLTHHHLSLFKSREVAVEDALVLPWREDDQRKREPQVEDHWMDHYLGYLRERPDSISQALRVIAGAEGAAVVHCAAGKDRTGTVIALALSLAGVSDEDIAADYAATSQRLPRILERLSAVPAYAENLQGRPLSDHETDPQTMVRLLAAVRETSGSVADWLRDQGWTDEDLEQLRRRLTQP